MSYSDVIGATKLYGDLLNNNFANTANNLNNVKMDYAPVNPYSSGAYSPRSARNIYTGEGRSSSDPVSDASNVDLSTTEKAAFGLQQGMGYSSMANKLSPYIQSGASNLMGSLSKSYMSPASAASFNLGPASFVYGATRNQNPYDYTKMESMGTTASTMMAAHQASKLFASANAGTSLSIGAGGMNPYVLIGSYLLSQWFNKKGKASAKKARDKVYKGIEENQDDIYTARAEDVEENREKMQSDYQAQSYNQRQGRYDNQYGGNYDPRRYAEEGMKMDGDIVAEFTGNELIVNDQDKVEKGLASGNYAMAAAPIKQAIKNKQLTPGPETHKGNPMPVDSGGNIYADGGTLPFKAKKGSGIYDHATDQFKSGMTNKEIAMVAQENINKWESNGMA